MLKLQEFRQEKTTTKPFIPLGKVGYMDHTTPFGTAKNQSFGNIQLEISISLDNFLQRPFWSPFHWSKNHAIYSSNWRPLSCGLLCTCSNHLNRFSVIFSLAGVTSIFSRTQSFCILSFLYDHTSILTFSFLLLPRFSHVPLKLNITIQYS